MHSNESFPNSQEGNKVKMELDPRSRRKLFEHADSMAAVYIPEVALRKALRAINIEPDENPALLKELQDEYFVFKQEQRKPPTGSVPVRPHPPEAAPPQSEAFEKRENQKRSGPFLNNRKAPVWRGSKKDKKRSAALRNELQGLKAPEEPDQD